MQHDEILNINQDRNKVLNYPWYCVFNFGAAEIDLSTHCESIYGIKI